jgi:hypothetical protein
MVQQIIMKQPDIQIIYIYIIKHTHLIKIVNHYIDNDINTSQ